MGSAYDNGTYRRWLDGYKPFPSQLKFNQSTANFKGFSGPVGAGKSKALAWEAIKQAYENSGCMGLVGSPTYRMLEDSTKASMLEILGEEEIPYDLSKSHNMVTMLEPGSTILFRALDTFERLRGTNLAWFGIDEMTYCKEEAWLRLEARLRDPKAKRLCGFGVWTPRGRDWVYRRCVDVDSKMEGFECVFAKPGENVVVGAKFYESLKRSYDDKFYRQEALGEYLNVFEGQVYHAFSMENVAELVYDPLIPLHWSLDFNREPMCSVIAQVYDPAMRNWVYQEPKTLKVLDEIVLNNADTSMACEAFAKRVGRWYSGTPITVYVYGDASGENTKQTTSGASDFDVVRAWFAGRREFQLRFRVPQGNPLVKDRINAVNGLLCNFEGERRLLVDRKCERLRRDFEEVSWEVDKTGRTTGGINKTANRFATHTSDALGYMVIDQFPVLKAKGAVRDYLT